MELSYDTLLTILTLANGSERSIDQQEAENQLKKWETVPGYHYLLQEIYLKIEVPLQIRWLAVICFKNGVDKYWRSSRQHAISKEEKSQIKSRVFLLLHEKNNQLTVQNAHCISKIARYDFPSEWPTLFDDIGKSLDEFVFKSNDLVSTNNLLIILNRIVKTLSMVRIGRARHAMQTKAPAIATILIKLYTKFFRAWITTLEFNLMEICYLCLKNLRRIIPEGFDLPHKNQDVSEFLSSTIDHLQLLVLEHEKYSSDLLERYVKCYSKLYVELISSNPTSFILLSSSQKIITTFLSLLEQKAETIYNSSEENDFWEILALKGFIILKKIMAHIYKKGTITLKQRNDKNDLESSVKKISDIFTPDVIQHLCDLIINWYLRLKPSDLEGWLLEPEEWCNEELSSSWEYQIRPCSENFYQDLIKYFQPFLQDFIIKKISNGLMENESVDKILIKDSILCTFQLSSSTISNNVNFDQLLNDVFIPEGLKNDLVENKILKRRICLIIGEWVSIQCSRESRINIYKLLINFLNPDNQINDKVVKIASIQTLRNVIDDWDFNKYDFKPFLNDFVKLLLSLLSEMSLTESKLYILNTLAVLIEKSNPLVDYQTLINILMIIPNYWEASDNEPILKNSLLRVMKSLIVSLNENSVETHAISISLIKSCCSQSDVYSLLSEDGYDLWLVLLQYCPDQSNQDILNLFQLITYGLINSTEVLPTILSILRSYSLYSPEVFANNSTEVVEIMKILADYLPSMRDDAFNIFVSFADILFLENCEQDTNSQFITNLISSGLFNSMVNYILDESHAISLSNKIFLVISRLAKSSPSMFFQVLDHLSIDTQNLLNVWLKFYNNNGNPRNKKVNLLGLLSVTCYGTQNNPSFTPTLIKVIEKSFFFLEEINENDQGNCDVYKQDFIYEDINDYSFIDSDIVENGEVRRYKRLLETNDPVYKTNVLSYLKNIVLELKSNLGMDFDNVMNSMDQYSLERLLSIV